ncbi:hypothetical protein L208DRAFT_597772 [Tricholoma matsutake]|nr:hypothetical protein L208DRAFT_597772 [Tricholoma matsutake 945]
MIKLSHQRLRHPQTIELLSHSGIIGVHNLSYLLAYNLYYIVPHFVILDSQVIRVVKWLFYVRVVPELFSLVTPHLNLMFHTWRKCRQVRGALMSFFLPTPHIKVQWLLHRSSHR